MLTHDFAAGQLLFTTNSVTSHGPLLFTTNSVTSNPAALIIFAVVGGIFVNYLRRNQNDIGGGMGKDYMKEHWGIDDDK